MRSDTKTRVSRRTLVGSGLVGVAGLWATACGPALGGAPTGGSTSGSALQTKQPITLTWWASNGQDVGFAAIKDGFMQRFPNVTVNYEAEASHLNPEKLIAALLADQAPDAMRYADAGLGDMAFKGALRVLDSHMRTSKLYRKDDFYPRLLDSGKWAGKFYAIPFLTDVRPLFWNKEAFTAQGINRDKGPANWDDLKDFTVRLTRRQGDNFERVGFIPLQGNSWLYLFGWLNGGESVQLSPDGRKQRCILNDTKWVQALDYMVSLYTLLGGKERMDAWWKEANGSGAQQAILTGRLAMMITTNGLAGTFGRFVPNSEYGYSLPPAPRGRQPLTWSGIWNMIVPSGAKRPEEAAEYIAYVTSVDGARAWAEGALQNFRVQQAGGDTGYWLPALSTNRAAGDAIFEFAKSQMPERGQQLHRFAQNALQTSRSRPVIPGGLEIWDAQKGAQEDALAGKGSPAVVLEDWTRRVNAKYQEMGVLM